MLDKKFKVLFDEGICYPNTLGVRGLFVEYTLADPEGRLRTAFVDYCADRWLLEQNVKADFLMALVDEIRNKLSVI